MAQNVVLDLGDTAATSSQILVDPNTTATLVIYTDDAAGIPANEGVLVFFDTPGQEMLRAVLSASNPSVSIVGPAEILLKRSAGGVQKGVVRYS